MEKVLGFSIEIKGQESELSKMSDLKREIIAVEDQINKLKDATKGNIGAQKASATQMAELEATLKALKKSYNEQEKALIDNATGVTKLKEEQKRATEARKAEVVEQKKLAKEQKQSEQEAKNLAKQEAALAKERQKAQVEIQRKIQKEEELRIKNTHVFGSYNQLVQVNKQLSAELRAMPIDPTNAKFKQLQAQLNANTEKLKDFDKEIGRSFRNVGNYGDSLKSIAGSLGIAFGLNEIISFGKEAVQTAAKVEGIERAFRALSKPGLLDELREATKGTVSDMELMKAAVNANNFQIPLETMANLLKFAQQRAQETGQSVDYLVESIVTGIARKSPLILDNLGINVQRINTKFKETGDFAKAAGMIIEEELQKQGTLALTTADKISRLDAMWQNLKATLGKSLVNEFNAVLEYFEVLGGKLTFQELQMRRAAEQQKKIATVFGDEMLKIASKSENDKAQIIYQTNLKIIETSNKIQKEGNAVQRAILQEQLKGYQNLYDQLKKEAPAAVKTYTEEELKEIEAARKKKEDEIKKNNEMILKLSAELAKGQVDLMEEGIEKEKEKIKVKYKLEIDELKRQLINKKKLREDEIKLNEQINKRIAQLEQQQSKDLEKLDKEDVKKKEQIAFKKLEIEEQIAIEEAKQAYDNEEEKQEAILAIQKEYAQQKIDLLQASSDAETDEVRLQIARLQTVIDSEIKTKKPKKGESPFEKMFGTDAETAKVAIDSALQLAKQISDAIFEAQSARNQRLLDNNLQAIEAQSETELMLLENRLRNGQITEAQFAQEKKEIDAKQRQDEIAAKREAFEKEKKLKKQQIAITLALELIKIAAAYAEIPYVGWATAAIQAAAATAAAGVQMAVIDNQKFAQGGIAKGPSHANGGIPFTVQGQGGYEMEGGEAIINKRSTAMFGGLLSIVNQLGGGKKFAQGGIPLPMSNNNSILPQLGLNMDSFAERIVSGINNKKVYQTESDVRGVIQRVSQIESESTF